MENKQTPSSLSNSIQNWLITLSIIFCSTFAVVVSLVCIFALPDRTSQPLLGSAFYIGGVFLLCTFLILRWKKEKVIAPNKTSSPVSYDLHCTVLKETLSDKIIKWFVAIFSAFFIVDGIAIALICIYSLPTGDPQPLIGALFFIGGAIVLSVFILVVWKNHILEKT